MAQLLITREPAWYQNIASVKNYYEKQFEDKVLKYATDIFNPYYVFKCKYTFTYKLDRSEKYQPDILLVSKTLKRWFIVELETCGKSLSHTKKQLRCFYEPEFKKESLVDYLIDQNSLVQNFRKELLDMFDNVPPKVLVVYDDYCSVTFDKLKSEFDFLQICVVETYRTDGHTSEAYRISGDYPYDISGTTQLKPFDFQHYEILRPDLFSQIPVDQEIIISYMMKDYKAVIFRVENLLYLKIPQNPFPPDINLILSIDISNNLIIKRI